MTGVHAWISSAVNNEAATKALVLAASLHRARTWKKLVVIVSSDVCEDLTCQLDVAYDLLIPLLRRKSPPNGLTLEDSAKIQAFSLTVFSKCVYLPPHFSVVRNCDDVFDNNAPVGTSDAKKHVDSSVYMFTPSTIVCERMRASIAGKASAHDKVNGLTTMCSAIEGLVERFEFLGPEYNVRISLKENPAKHVESSGIVRIVNFTDVYPLELYENGNIIRNLTAGAIEKHAIDVCWDLWHHIKLWSSEEHVSELDLSLRTSPRCYDNEPIAIVGVSFRLPGGNTPDEFWDLLVSGREGIKPLPPFRWTKEHSCFPCKNRKVEAGFLDMPIDEFDAKFFGLSPKEAVFLDPQQRLLHELSWHALEDAGMDPHYIQKTNAGVFVGSWIHDYKDLTLRSTEVDFFRTYMGNSVAATAARLSHFLGTTGPSIATESGCSSSIVAVDMACKSLRNRDSSLALACGVNLLIHPFDSQDIEMVVAPDGRCKTFDAKANGFGRAEGCAVLVLKRLSDAFKDENRIWGLIRGSAVTQEGTSRSLGTPTIHCEALAMELALRDACVDPKDVCYVETHGTGTPIGDPLEIGAIEKVYSSSARDSPLLIGSVKTNIGHTESVSGIAGIIKVLLSLKNETIPPHRNLETLNPEINLRAIPAEIPLQPIPWPRNPSTPRIAGVSSFGISGTDGHVILEEAPATPKFTIDFKLERPLHIMKISAKSPESMEELLQTHEQICRERRLEEGGFANFAYSANTGRSTFNYRAVVVAKDFHDSERILKSRSLKHADVTRKNGSICFLFPGQGCQYPDMASTLYSTSPVFRMHFDKCCDMLEKSYNILIKNVLWGNGREVEELNRTLYSQISIFCVEYSLLKLWESWGVTPDIVLGHSLGEFAAAVAGGALTFEDALMLVAERSRLIDNLPRGKMLVIQSGKRSVEKEIIKYRRIYPSFWADFAALNTSDQTVIAGDSDKIEEFAKHCKDNSIKAIVLASEHAFHSRHMDPMLEEYEQIASRIKSPPKINPSSPKYVSGMEGKVVNAAEMNREYWLRHTSEKVNFVDACKAVQSEGCSIFIEIGPHPIASTLMMHNLDEGSQILCLPSIRRSEPEWETLLSSLSNLYLSEWKGDIDWNGFDQYYNRRRVDLPFYPFNKKPIWIKFERIKDKLHPLLGSKIRNASNQSIFENRISTKTVNYLQDHVIGSRIIFPGAAFLELILAGGYASVQGLAEEWRMPRRPIVVSNVRIAAPLLMSESESSLIQTVMTLEQTEDKDTSYSLSVYRNKDSDPNSSTDQWRLHSSGTFHPALQKKPEELVSKINILDIQNSWAKQENRDFYEKLTHVGLHFGPKFQSLECGWESESGSLMKVRGPEEDDHLSYLVHPLLADAMIQAIMLWMSKGKIKKLPVPVRIGQFIWLTTISNSSEFYIYCSTSVAGMTYSLLLDKSGNSLAFMADVEFMETSVKLIEGLIQQQSTVMPGLWEEVWKSKPGPCQNRLVQEDICFPHELLEKTEEELRKFNNFPEEERLMRRNLSELTNFLFLKALYNLGWSPEEAVIYKISELVKSLSILESHTRFVRFFITRLASCGILKLDNSDGFSFAGAGNVLTLEEISEKAQELINKIDKNRTGFKLVIGIGDILDEALAGKASPLSVLFPQDPSKPNAGDLYRSEADEMKPVFFLTFESFVFDQMLDAIEKQKEEMSNTLPIFRILEVGAGTGMLTRMLVNYLMEKGVQFEYYYTDISPAFFSAAEKDFGENAAKNIVFKKLDMEEDPLEQGFCPEYFDMILAVETIHIAKDVVKTLQNLRSLLSPGGVIVIEETIIENPSITFIFGLLEGYWRFEDLQLRELHPALSAEKWTQALHSAGFPRVEWRPAVDSAHGIIIGRASDTEQISLEQVRESRNAWLIFHDGSLLSDNLVSKLARVNRKVVLLRKPQVFTEEGMKREIKGGIKLVSESAHRFEGIIYLWGLTSKENRDQNSISLPFLTVLQLLPKCGKLSPKVVVVTQGIYCVRRSLVENPCGGTLRGLMAATANENVMFDMTQLDLDPTEDALSQVDDIFYNIWAEQNIVAAVRNGQRFVLKLALGKVENESCLALPSGCQRFQLELPQTRLISDLEFVSLVPPHQLQDDEVEVKVKAFALNLRDVFTVLKPTHDFEELNTVGVDLSGQITKIGSKVRNRKVGDRIIGLNTNRNLSLPSHAIMKATHTIALPSNLSYAEGSTFPAVFSTSILCLVQVAKLQRGETVLVHTASGGIGLAAIQVARHVGAIVIATAGSERKRNYLRKLVGIEHVFHSRTTDFGEGILQVTSGRGVDIVLNSLTGAGFKEASLAALALNGRFIEMSKLNVWKEEDVKQRRPDVLYEIVDISSFDESACSEMATEVERFLREDLVKPIPYERFDAVNIRGALTYLQKAKHIGKIVCVMPEVIMDKSGMTVETPLFNENGTYLVTGGLGGIGFEVVKWILRNGGKHVVIASRSQPKVEVAAEISSWNKSGQHVEAISVDIGSFEECRKLFDYILSSASHFPPLRGIMHAAGVLKDGLLENQTWESFQKTYNPKVNGTWNLHDLTKDLQLEHFVLFSSMAATLGSPGQSNHSASNSFEDAFAHFRKSVGLPALSVNWGLWGEVGVGTEVDFPGVRPMSTSEAFHALQVFLKTQTTHIAAVNIESIALLSTLFPKLKTFIDDQKLFGASSKSAPIINCDEFWKKVDSVTCYEEKLLTFKQFIKTIVRTVLKLDGDEEIDDETDFQTLGIDSLMMLEMKNGLMNILGKRMTVTVSQLRNCRTTEVLALRLIDILDGEEYLRNMPSLDELKLLIREDCVLPQEIAPTEEMRKAKNIDGVEVVLVTGATGNIGPYLLRELSQRENIKKIYCLIRKRGKHFASIRLQSKLASLELLDEVDMSKVECVEGNISNARFGFSEEKYEELGRSVDAIIHSAALVLHNDKYWKAPEQNRYSLRTTNVLGTLKVLKFAVHQKLKHVLYLSAIVAATSVNEKGRLSEDWQDVGAFDDIPENVGYPVSKHICEQLIKQAIERGIPCKALRLPFVGGDSRTGRYNFETSHLLLRALAFMKLECMPDVSIPIPIIPVDKCAEICMRVFFDTRLASDVIHICERNPEEDDIIIEIAEEEHGVHIETVCFSEFLEKLKTVDENSVLAQVTERYHEKFISDTVASPTMTCLRKYLENRKDFFTNEKIRKLFPDFEEALEPANVVLRRDLQFLKQSGVFKAFRIAK